jgi:hypothetical protein
MIKNFNEFMNEANTKTDRVKEIKSIIKMTDVSNIIKRVLKDSEVGSKNTMIIDIPGVSISAYLKDASHTTKSTAAIVQQLKELDFIKNNKLSVTSDVVSPNLVAFQFIDNNWSKPTKTVNPLAKLSPESLKMLQNMSASEIQVLISKALELK